MNSEVFLELKNLFEFFLLGFVIAIIFDFFRAYRKFKRPTDIEVLIQDIIFFFITTIIVIFGIINILDSNIRLYIFIAVFSGIGIYLSIISKYVIKIYNRFFEVIDSIIEFIFTPFYLFKQIIIFIFKKIHKICKICCKKFLYMLILIKRGIRSIDLKKFNNIKNKKNKKKQKTKKVKKAKNKK